MMLKRRQPRSRAPFHSFLLTAEGAGSRVYTYGDDSNNYPHQGKRTKQTFYLILAGHQICDEMNALPQPDAGLTKPPGIVHNFLVDSRKNQESLCRPIFCRAWSSGR